MSYSAFFKYVINIVNYLCNNGTCILLYADKIFTGQECY
jgi:hypothetical protein